MNPFAWHILAWIAYQEYRRDQLLHNAHFYAMNEMYKNEILRKYR